MRRHRWGMAAALCALAVFAWMGAMGAVWLRRTQRTLTIEVISPQADVLAMAQETRADAPTVLIYHMHTWES